MRWFTVTVCYIVLAVTYVAYPSNSAVRIAGSGGKRECSAQIGNVTIELRRGLITDLDEHFDVLVNAANPDLARGGGLCGQIFDKAGAAELSHEIYALKREGKIITPLAYGLAVATAAYRLKARYIIHAVGPDFRLPSLSGKSGLLEGTYISILTLAQKLNCTSIALPLLSASIYRGNRSLKELAQETMMGIETFISTAGLQCPIKRIILVAYTAAEMLLYGEEFERVFNKKIVDA